MSSKLVLIFLGVLLCYVDAGRVRRDEWSVGLGTRVRNRRLSLTGNLGYENKGFRANGHYTETFGGRDSWGAGVGYNNGGFSSSLDYSGTQGYHHVGVSLGYKFKRSLEMQKDAFVLRVEADPCQFMLYDRNFDGVITGEEVHKIFPDENLADGLFKNLDSNDDGKVTAEEFETAKVHTIVGCAPRAVKKLLQMNWKPQMSSLDASPEQ